MLSSYIKEKLTQKQFESWTQASYRKNIRDKLSLVSTYGLNQCSLESFLEFLFQAQREFFQARFLPSTHQPRFACHLCDQTFGAHIQLRPCLHLFCEKCTFDLCQTHCCPLCNTAVTDVGVNRQLRDEQLETVCFCENSGQQLATDYAEFYEAPISEENLDLLRPSYRCLDAEALQLQERFNAGGFSHNQLNGMRQHLAAGDCLERAGPDVQNILLLKREEVRLKHYFYKQIPISIAACAFQGPYAQMEEHLRHCSQHRVSCQKCGLAGPRKAVQRHQDFCLSAAAVCPVCLRRFQTDQVTDHACECLKQLARQPDENCVDVKLEYNVQVLLRDFQALAQNLKRYLIKSQFEVIHDYEVLSKQTPLSGCFSLLLERVYKKNALLGCVTFQFACIVAFDTLSQLFSLQKSAIGLVIIILQFVNAVLMFVQLQHQLKTGMYTPDMFAHMFKVYLSVVFNFAGLYTFIQLTSPRNFMDIRNLDVYDTYVDMLYFASIVGAKSGLGDVHPNTPLCRILVAFQILFSALTLCIFFRGSTFFLKISSIESSAKNIQKQIQETEYLLNSSLATSDLMNYTNDIQFQEGKNKK
ncbi:Transmembrane_domain-containing protein [Hexamita inflata]|uniref:Transmembrane domain-containing protein n=1 Tax=Hexamita inflata TaxID=28002 RepID=A0AA86UCZ2_9EUKA|nr:Transmembrane domain-containing protein [Hexamita inflata]